jgi:predicted  nucleic acid-binding Zn-ribbon protein
MTAGSVLREIHRLRRNAKDLKSRIDQGPRQQQTQKDKVARQEEILRTAQDELKHLKVENHQKEVSLKALDEKIKKYDKQLSDIMSKKEYDALKHELAHARDEVAKLEDQILDVLGEIEERTAKMPELENNLREARAQAAQFERDYEARMASLAQQQQEVLQKLKEVEATLPEDIRPHYERLTNAKGEDALAVLSERTCSACYTEVTAQNYSDLVRGLFVLCKSCGRMLYISE